MGSSNYALDYILKAAVFLCCQLICKLNWNGKKETSLGCRWMRSWHLSQLSISICVSLITHNSCTNLSTEFVFGRPNNGNICAMMWFAHLWISQFWYHIIPVASRQTLCTIVGLNLLTKPIIRSMDISIDAFSFASICGHSNRTIWKTLWRCAIKANVPVDLVVMKNGNFNFVHLMRFLSPANHRPLLWNFNAIYVLQENCLMKIWTMPSYCRQISFLLVRIHWIDIYCIWFDLLFIASFSRANQIVNGWHFLPFNLEKRWGKRVGDAKIATNISDDLLKLGLMYLFNQN